MAITLLATSTGIGAGGASTPAIDTTGASLLVVSVSWYSGGGNAPSVSDNKGNTFTPLTLRNAGTAAQRLYYAQAPVVGPGHQVFAAGVSIFAVGTVHAFSGVATSSPFESENGATAISGSSLAAGSVTPTENGALIVSGWAGMNGTSNPTVDSGLTQTVSQNPVAGTCLAGAAAYKIQTTAAAINPTWSWTGSDHVAESVAVFKPVAEASTVTTATQLVVELADTTPSTLRATQLATEYAWKTPSDLRGTQLVIEIIRRSALYQPPGCVPAFPVDDVPEGR